MAVSAFAVAPIIMTSGCHRTARRSCFANLRLIDGAKAMVEVDRGLTNGAAVTRAQLMPYLGNKWPQCPERGCYTVGAVGESPRCSYREHRDFQVPPH
jgi:hypothetical protein